MPGSGMDHPKRLERLKVAARVIERIVDVNKARVSVHWL